MKGKRLRQAQGHGDQQGRREVDCVLVQFGAPPNWKSSAMLGLGALTALTFYSPSPAFSFPPNLLKIFFSQLGYPLPRLVPQVPPTPAEPVQLLSTFHSAASNCPFSPPTQDDR